MYAIVETGGKQYRVKPGDTVAVERLSAEPGETLDLEPVLLVAGSGDEARVGSPGVAGAVVRAEVVEHARGEKIVVFRYKSKVRYRRKTGHRQALTRLRISDIMLDGHSTSATPAQEAPVAEPRAIDRFEVPTEPVLEETATTTEGRAGQATAAAERAAEAETDLPAWAGEAGSPPGEAEPE